MPSITITRALSKIKTLTSQIENDTKVNVYISTSSNNMIGTDSYKRLVSSLEGNKESFENKISQIISLKKLIAESNLNSSIIVAGKEVTVTEALVMKETMSLYSKFYLTLRKQHAKSSDEVTQANQRIHSAVTSNISEISSSSDIKNDDLEARLDMSAKQLQHSMGVTILAGTYKNAEDYLEDVKNYIDNFNSEIDYLLSEHNSTTTIEVN